MADKSLNLFCLVDGESIMNAFKVEIEKTKKVSALKELIKTKKSSDFNDIDADKLSLWQVLIPEGASEGQKGNVFGGLTEENKLSRLQSLLLLFPQGAAEGFIHIVVKPPKQAPKRGREPKLKTSQKLLKILSATGVSETRIFQTTADESRSDRNLQVELPHDLPNFFSWRIIAGTIFADKTPYIEELEKGATNYRYIFLRPRRFGKSAFLNMLCAYYDVHTADIFDDLFGPPYIGRHPTTSKNKHLVLKLDLSTISVFGTLEAMTTSFNTMINGVLIQFLQEYNSELGYPEENKIIDNEVASQSLMNILSLAGTRRQSLFVGVDEYDAPVNNSAFAGGNTGLGSGSLDNVQHIEQFFKEKLFSILKAGCSTPSRNEYGVVISKYFLTGVTPAFRADISPLAAAAVISNKRSLQGICGFSENEVTVIVKHYLHMNDQEAEPLLHSIRRLYNGYCFALTGHDESSSPFPFVYNPHLVLHYLSSFQSKGFVANPEESIAVPSTAILKSIADVGEFSVNDLVELLVSKSVQSKIITEFGYSELLSVGKDRVITWSLLFYLGILTRGPNGFLRVPNNAIKSKVLDRMATFLRTQENISALMVPAIRSLKAGNAKEFCQLLETFFSYRALRSLKNANEAVLQGVVELLLDEPSNCVPEFRLVVDGSKEPGDGRFGFVDIFIPRQAMVTMSEQTCVVMELKNATLEGLRKGITSQKSDCKGMEGLRELLSTEDESTLLMREYAYWSQVDGEWKIVTLESIMEDGVKQLKRYMKTIAMGKVQSYNTSGVLDSRVNINPGLDDLEGYVIMAIGGARLLARHVGRIETECGYVRAFQL
ncbi:hypothetical protein EDD11_000271 [Mortierella claussenii]|nr:hypothetical protein EDD11_000271 [Mortierella claussenii]